MKFRYEELEIVDDIHTLITNLYEITERWPSQERYSLTSQARRAATSILLNLAEGSARRSSKEYARFIKISIGSVVELDAAIKIAINLKFMPITDWSSQDENLKKIFYTLTALRKTIEAKAGSQQPS
jgi:four helix bundle protein